MFSQKFNSSVRNTLFVIPSSLVLGIASIVAGIHPVVSQPAISACQAPRPGEYVLLVVSPSVTNN
ncbi:MAG: hypothetical protein F6K62_07350, partial [Sphaerospermopsis sp. SIO1G2]|nr:hypothetical protein [Sphaerospermopsis sp. SIO1G2]